MQSTECTIRVQVVLQSVQCVSDYRTWKTVRFSKDNCQGLDEGKLVTIAIKIKELYYLNFHVSDICSNAAETKVTESKEDRLHHRFGHLRTRSLQILA